MTEDQQVYYCVRHHFPKRLEFSLKHCIFVAFRSSEKFVH